MIFRTVCLTLCFLAAAACKTIAPEPEQSSEAKIVGGVHATGWEWVTYHTVALSTLPLIEDGDNFCSGTLIAWNAVLSAAHCFAETPQTPVPQNPYVLFGTHIHSAPAIRRKVTKIVMPKTYKEPWKYREGPGHDLAIVFFEGLPPAGWRPAYVMPQNALYPAGMQMLAAGYGMTWPNMIHTTGNLKWLPLYLRQMLPVTREVNVHANWGQSTCQGDSGGPLYAVYNGVVHAVAGVTSWGANPCFYGNGHYVDLRYYNQWIHHVLATGQNPPGM